MTGVTDELTQEICAKCLCNITNHDERQDELIANSIIPTILLVCLVKSVARVTRNLCARALLNLIQPANMQQLVSGGVIRAIASIASVTTCSATKHICAKAFLSISACSIGRIEIGQRKIVLDSLFSLVNSANEKTKIVTGKATCNLLSSPETKVQSLQAGALNVLKIIAALSNESLREITAQTLLHLLEEPNLHPYLVKEPIVPILAMILQNSNSWAFECALQALSCMSQYSIFRIPMVDKGFANAIVFSIVSGKISDDVLAFACARSLCHITFVEGKIESLVKEQHLMLILRTLFESNICSLRTVVLLMLCVRNITYCAPICMDVVNDGIIRLINGMLMKYSHDSHLLCQVWYHSRE
jgi:hypothetical protein